MSRIASLLPLLPACLGTALAAQSTLTMHGETVFGSGLLMPSSQGASPNDFPAGARMRQDGLVTAALQPVMDAEGTLVFAVRAKIDAALGIDNSNAQALLRGRGPSDLRMLLRTGDTVPGLPSTTRVAQILTHQTSPFGGHLLLGVRLDDPVVPANTGPNADTALLIGQPGSWQVLMREGDPAPIAGPGAVWGEIDTQGMGITSSGTVLFRNNLQAGIGGITTTDNAIMVFGTPGNLTVVARNGSPWTGAGAAGEVVQRVSSTASFVANNVRLTDDGHVLHDLKFAPGTGTATSTANDRVLAIWDGIQDHVLAREGDQAPGMPGFFFGDLAGATVCPTQRGDLLLFASVSNGVPRNVNLQHTAEHGWRLFFDTTDPFAAPVGTTTQPTIFAGITGTTADNTTWLVNNQGDVACVVAAATAEVNVFGCTYKRGHIGSLIAKPAAVPATGGVPQQFLVDCGPGHANRFYFLLATSTGTRPGFPSPLGPQLVPLNFDPTWTQLSLSLANTSVWSGTFGFTDASGKGVGPASFTLPPGLSGFAGMSLHHAALLFDTALVSHFVTEPAGLLLH